MLSSTSRIICTPASSMSCSRFILSSISFMIDRMRFVFPSQQNTYSKMDRSSFTILLVIPCEKGVSTTHGMSGNSSFTALATVKASLSAFPGIHITRSMLVVESTSDASTMVLTCVKVGGYRSPSSVYSLKIFSSTRPSSSSMKASYGLAMMSTLNMRWVIKFLNETSFR